MNLVKFIASIGDQEAASLFGVKERIAASWRRLERTPGSTNTAVIIKASKGKIQYEDILAHREFHREKNELNGSTPKRKNTRTRS